jgi:hypothetical protein
MSKTNTANLDKFHELMFSDLEKLPDLGTVQLQQLLRYRFAFTTLLQSPSTSDIILRDAMMNQFDISMSQAYRDIANLKILLPNIRNAGKEWIRYIVNEELKLAIQSAKDQGKLKEHILAISALAKYNKLDQDEAEEMPWDDIIPIPIEPTSDPTVLGIVPLENKEEVIRQLYEKYKGEIEIDDIEYEVLKDESTKETDIFQ